MAKKLAIVLSVLLTGVGMAHCFRKDAVIVQPSERTQPAPAFREPVARHLIPAPPSRPTSVDEIPPAITSPFRIPLAETRAAGPNDLPTQQPTFHHELRAESSIFRPQDAEPNADETASSQQSDAQASSPTFITHTIADGDTLSGLAAKYLDRADRYREIFDTNRDVLRSPDLLPIGKVLRIRQPQPSDVILQAP